MIMEKDKTKSLLREARTTWRNRGARTDLTIGITGTVTLDAVVPYMGSALMQRGVTPDILLAPFNQMMQTLMNPAMAFEGAMPDVIVALPRLDEIAGNDMARFCAGDASGWDIAERKLAELADAVAHCRTALTGILIVGNFPIPMAVETEIPSTDNLARVFFERANNFWTSTIAKNSNIQLLDFLGLQNDVGMRNAADTRRWYLYRQPFSDQFLFELGSLAARIIFLSRGVSKKCAVIDCDNTLWGGIIGEDGMAGIKLGDEFPGSAYRDFQKLLAHWRNQGIFLAVCSKNNLADVQEVFRNHTGMYLKEDAISAWSVNWKPKSEQMIDIADQLNIGIDALVLYDDSRFELAEVAAQHPGIGTVQVPEEPEDIITAVRHAHMFDKLKITTDDRVRAERYAVEEKRETMRKSLTIEDFIRGLELKVDTVSPTSDNIARIAQLVNKTNQFNITTPRFTQEEITLMAASGRHIVRAATVCDKFGEYGLTCVGILENKGDAWDITAFLMSCRVLGRGVETYFLADIAYEVLARGGDKITGHFIPTKKNAMSANFLPQHGFVESDGVWHSHASMLARNRPAGTGR